MPGQPMTEEQKRKKRERERQEPQFLFLDTKPLIISTDALFEVNA